jgi:hypothetical protein
MAVHPANFMERLDNGAEHELVGAAFRWAVIVGDNKALRLQLQGLPAAAVMLSGRHQFKGSVHQLCQQDKRRQVLILVG